MKLLFSQKHTEDVLVFLSQLEINLRKLNFRGRNGRGMVVLFKNANFLFID